MADDTKPNPLAAFRVIGRDNWTAADHAESARRDQLNRAASEARKAAMRAAGWAFHYRHCSRDDPANEFALDPVGGGQVSHEEAYRLQEARSPGSVPPWPTFDNDWRPPASNPPEFIEIPKIEPMALPTALVFYQDYLYNKDS